MEEYIGLDVSMKETVVSIRREGKRIWRGRCASDPRVIADLIRKRAPAAKRVVFETGPLSVWFYHVLCAEGLPAICIDARHAKAALDMAANKTDANDADGLAELAEVGFLRAVRVKGFDSMLARTLVMARTRLVRVTTELSNQIRGIMKTFGLVVPAGKGSTFEKNVRSLLVDQQGLAPIVLPILEAWRGLGFAPLNSDANSSPTLAKAKPAASSCRSPGLARSPRPPSQPPLRIRTTSKSLGPSAPGSA
jgi:transposase